MTGYIMDVKRFAVHDGPGIRTTVFLKGCPLRCIWCHNPEGLSSGRELSYQASRCINCGECVPVCPQGAHGLTGGKHSFDRKLCCACGSCEKACLGSALKLFGKTRESADVLQEVLLDKIFYQQSKGGLTVSGGEPLFQYGFCGDLLRKARKQGIHTAVDTSGAVSWRAFESVLPYTDIFLYDIKHIDTKEHKKYTGMGNEIILENLSGLSKRGSKIEIRLPLIPDINSNPETIKGIGAFLSSIKGISGVRVLPYRSLSHSKYRMLGLHDTMPEVDSPDLKTITETVNILRSFDLTVFFD
jgi:pyruvate formate lyase activating enzyme